MEYVETVKIKRSEFERINTLLKIPSLEEMSKDELTAIGAATDTCEGIFEVDFEDGSFLTWDLCSGSGNYYDDVVWHNSEDTLDCIFDCFGRIESIEFESCGNKYTVNIEIEEEETDGG